MGIFDDAKTVMIGNKEVQSIITSNGGVIYEKPSGWSLVLTGDKSVMMTGETATLTATLTRNNVPVSGETIIFYDADYTPLTNPGAGAYNPQYSLGNSFSLYYASKGGTHIYIESNDLTIAVDRNGLVKITDDNHSWTTLWTSKSSLNLRNGVLSDDEGHSYDISSYNNNFTLTTIYGAGSVYLEFYGVAITNVNGVATVGYTGKGTGDLNIKAYAPERIISSEIYLLEDCIIYDVTEYTAPQQFNNSMPLPSTFKIEYEAYYPSGTCASFLIVGETSNGGGMLVGKVVSTYDGYMIIARKNSNGSGDANAVYGSTIPRNNWISQTITYDGTNFNFNNGDMNTTNLNTVQLTRINSFATYYTTGKIRNIKIKPL